MTINLKGIINKRISLSGKFDKRISLAGKLGVFHVPPDPIYENLISWWKLDEPSGVRYDSHSDLNAEEIPIPIGSIEDETGISANFDGTAYLQVPTRSELQNWHNNTTSWSGSLWFYPTRTDGSDFLMSIGSIGTNMSWQLYRTSANLIRILLYQSGSTFNYATTPQSPVLNAWNMVAWKHDHTLSRASISLNGAAFVHANVSIVMKTGEYPLNIGDGYGDVIPSIISLQGRIDSAALWRDYVLTDADLDWLWNEGSKQTYEDFVSRFGGGSTG